MDEPYSDYTAFLIRIRHVKSREAHTMLVSLEEAGSRIETHFKNLEELCGFLARKFDKQIGKEENNAKIPNDIPGRYPE